MKARSKFHTCLQGTGFGIDILFVFITPWFDDLGINIQIWFWPNQTGPEPRFSWHHDDSRFSV